MRVVDVLNAEYHKRRRMKDAITDAYEVIDCVHCAVRRREVVEEVSRVMGAIVTHDLEREVAKLVRSIGGEPTRPHNIRVFRKFKRRSETYPQAVERGKALRRTKGPTPP